MDKDYFITSYKNELPSLYLILDDLEKIVQTSDNFEGNCFYTNKTFIRNPELINKQTNLYWLGCNGCTNICEIGFNAGHSALLLLLGNASSEINFTIFDINHHTYTSECYDYIKTKFPQVNFDFIEGDSTRTIPKWTQESHKYETFDIIHVDGGHALDVIQNDFANSVKLLKKDGIIIIDDVQKQHIDDLVNAYIYSGMFEEITSMFETTFYPYRILKKRI